MLEFAFDINSFIFSWIIMNIDPKIPEMAPNMLKISLLSRPAKYIGLIDRHFPSIYTLMVLFRLLSFCHLLFPIKRPSKS